MFHHLTSTHAPVVTFFLARNTIHIPVGEFAKDIPGELTLHFFTYRPKSEPREYYVCLGDHFYNSPKLQTEAMVKKQFAFEEFT